MKTPRNVHGEQLAQHLERHWQYVRVHQTGSHIVLRTDVPSPLTVSVPAHKPVKVGTLQRLLKDVALHKRISVEELLRGL